jgi:uncharacterized protein (DUF302 family)
VSRSHSLFEHVLIASKQPYDTVLEALESRLGSAEGWREAARRVQALVATQASWEQISEVIESALGTSGFTLFNTVEHTPLLTLSGKASRAIQYTVGKPLLAIQMSKLQPEAALYAPLRFVVYEDEAGHKGVAYDHFISLLARYQREEITRVARVVEQKLEKLLTEVTQSDGAERFPPGKERKAQCLR